MGLELVYWPSLPGRGEFVRYALEYAKQPYTDKQDAGRVVSFISGKATIPKGSLQPLAPPILIDDDFVISQTPNILLYLGDKLDLAGSSLREKHNVHSLALTALDLNNEAHDTHHPIAVSEYYDQQKEEASKKAADFRKNRVPKFLTYFDGILAANESKSGLLVGNKVTYADLVLAHVVDGLFYAFPKCMDQLEKSSKIDRVLSLKQKIETETPIKEYLASDRRQKHSTDGIFRHYPELDG